MMIEGVAQDRAQIRRRDRAGAGIAEYLLLARLLRSAPTAAFLADLAGCGATIRRSGMAQIALAEAAGQRLRKPTLAAEYFALFIGVGRGELLPYASFYLTGFLHERPLARAARGSWRGSASSGPRATSIRRITSACCSRCMGGLAIGTFEADLAQQKQFFDRHVAPWAERFFADLAMSPSAKLLQGRCSARQLVSSRSSARHSRFERIEHEPRPPTGRPRQSECTRRQR